MKPLFQRHRHSRSLWRPNIVIQAEFQDIHDLFDVPRRWFDSCGLLTEHDDAPLL
jgi:hypothetical protein